MLKYHKKSQVNHLPGLGKRLIASRALKSDTEWENSV